MTCPRSAECRIPFLAIDIGNTTVHFGICDGERVLDEFRIPSVASSITRECPRLLKRKSGTFGRFTAAIISSVVPHLNPMMRMVCRHADLTPFWLNHETPTGIQLRYNDPREIGADRIANAVAVWEMYGGPAIVVDIGTAITFDCVSKAGAYLGGVITPGPRISREALAERTGLLPLAALKQPGSVIGKSTIHAIQSGMIYGTRALIAGVVRDLENEMEGRPRVVFTGGQLELIIRGWKYPKLIEPLLTLHGLRIIYRKNYLQL